MIEMETFKSREKWLAARMRYIGGSDASVIMGDNPWKNNVTLYHEKTGNKESDDLSGNELVAYGTNAEKYQRELFKLDYPDLEVEYEDNNMWVNSDYPFAHASLDGWFIDKDDNFGIFENKTATIMSAAQAGKWKGDNFPRYYYWQILHYMMVTNAQYAILRAQLKESNTAEVQAMIKHYRINRADVEVDMLKLMKAEKEFFQCIIDGREPALKLPM